MPEVGTCLMGLLGIPSVSGHEAALASHVAEVLRSTFPSSEVDVQDLGDGGANVLMKQGHPQLLLTTHLDTVPGVVTPRSDETTIWGRGACDAKGQIAVQICALAEAAANGAENFGCFFVSGEEVDSRGAKAALAHPYVSSTTVVNGEPTGLRFVTRSWGIIELELRAEGRAAHSSTSSGIRATHALVHDLSALAALENTERKVNIGVIAGGVASNVTAPQASALVGIRFRDDTAGLLADIKKCTRECDVTVRQVIDPLTFDTPTGASVAEVAFASDGEIYMSRFRNVMQFGPGDIEHAHTASEHVRINDLNEAVTVLAGLVNMP